METDSRSAAFEVQQRRQRLNAVQKEIGMKKKVSLSPGLPRGFS